VVTCEVLTVGAGLKFSRDRGRLGYNLAYDNYQIEKRKPGRD